MGWKRETCFECGAKFRYRVPKPRDAGNVPCPKCGAVEPESITRRRARIQHFGLLPAMVVTTLLAIAVIMRWIDPGTGPLAFLDEFLSFPLFHELPHWASMSVIVASLIVLRLSANRSVRREFQLTRAQEMVADRSLVLEDVPLPGVDQEPRITPEARVLRGWVLPIMFLAALVFGAPTVARLLLGWPLNGPVMPPVVGPGDDARLMLSESIQALDGHWSGRFELSAVNGAASGLPGDELPAYRRERDWGGAIFTEHPYNRTVFPSALLTIPDACLPHRTLRVTVEGEVVHPVKLDDGTYVEAQRQFDEMNDVHLSSLGAGRTYSALYLGCLLLPLGVFLCGLLVLSQRNVASYRPPNKPDFVEVLPSPVL